MDERNAAIPSTAGELIDLLEREVFQDVPVLSIYKATLDHLPRVRRMADEVAGVRSQIPAGMDSAGGSMVLPTIVVVVNALVTGALSEGQGVAPAARPPHRLGWLARRRLARRLGRRLAPAGTATPLPVLSPPQVARVVAEVRTVAANARLTDRENRDLCMCLEATLHRVAGRR